MSSTQASTALSGARNPRFSWWLRVLGAFVLLQVSLVQLLPALHHALVHHEVCAEHGELVHSSEASHGRARTAQNDSSKEGEAREPAYHADSAASHRHEHCGVFAAVREPGVAGVVAKLSLDVALAAPANPTMVAETEARPIELLALAPKLPPPCV